jgi:F-type H+-transporting ATPase subunit delta
MKNPRLAGRYAKSLLDLAVEKQALEPVLQDMMSIESLCNQSAEFCSMLKSPVIRGDKKVAVIKALLGDTVSPLTTGFVALVSEKSRENVLSEIASAFITQYKLYKNILVAKLTTALPASTELKATVEAKARALYPGQDVELEMHVDPAVIGGFLLEVGDHVIDATVRRDLLEVRKNFKDNLYVSTLIAS